MRSFILMAVAVSLTTIGLPAAAPAGTFAVMTYNVHGLPPIMVGSRAAEIAAIAARLEQFHAPLGPYHGIKSIVALQEVFSQNYQNALTNPSTVSYEYKTVKDIGGRFGLGDGLEILSDLRIDDFRRTPWDQCYGRFGQFRSDCDTDKGFLFARVHLEQNLSFDLYALHTDAGQDKGSEKARRANITQLVNAINSMSPKGTAVIVLGDTNSRYTRAGHDNTRSLLEETGVKDVWVQLRHGGVVPEEGPSIRKDCRTDPGSGNCELIDKIFYRSGANLVLVPQSYDVLKEMFSSADGRGLSDHIPVAVTFQYSRPRVPISRP